MINFLKALFQLIPLIVQIKELFDRGILVIQKTNDGRKIVKVFEAQQDESNTIDETRDNARDLNDSFRL